MAEKEKFNRTFIASMKRVARNVAPLTREKAKLNKEIAERQARLVEVEEEIAGHEVSIKRVTGGYTTEDLIERVVVDTGKDDKNGRPIKDTQFNLRYPETIVPPIENEGDKEVSPVDGLPFMTEDVLNPSTEI